MYTSVDSLYTEVYVTVLYPLQVKMTSRRSSAVVVVPVEVSEDGDFVALRAIRDVSRSILLEEA